MFTKRKTETDPVITELRDYIARNLADDTVTPEEFRTTIDQYTKLLIADTATKRTPVSADTLAMVGANLLGIAMILNHERAGIVTSKAIGFVSKLR